MISTISRSSDNKSDILIWTYVSVKSTGFHQIQCKVVVAVVVVFAIVVVAHILNCVATISLTASNSKKSVMAFFHDGNINIWEMLYIFTRFAELRKSGKNIQHRKHSKTYKCNSLWDGLRRLWVMKKAKKYRYKAKLAVPWSELTLKCILSSNEGRLPRK